MISIPLFALAGLLQAVASRSISNIARQSDPSGDVPVPDFKSDFKKNNVTAKWAPGHPARWGQEDSKLQFNEPAPDDTFGGAVTADEKYVVMFNGSHITFADLDSKERVSTFNLNVPSGIIASGLTVRPASDGGYHVLTGGATRKYSDPTIVYRRRVSSDLKPVGELVTYDTGKIGDFDKEGRMATTGGFIYDFNSNSSEPVVKLSSPPSITGMSFSGNAQYLSTIGWQDGSADLWNATTGDKILKFPATKAQNWLTKISPDNKYVIISLGTGFVQVYALNDLEAKPLVLGQFNNWIRAIEWSPDGKYLATGDNGRLQLWQFPGGELVQTWEVDSHGGSSWELSALEWFDGGRIVSWRYKDGTYAYDFETNERFWWTLGIMDHSWGGGRINFLRKKGLVVTEDGDSSMRFWKI